MAEVVKVKTLREHGNEFGDSYSKRPGDEYLVPADHAGLLVRGGEVALAGSASAAPAGEAAPFDLSLLDGGEKAISAGLVEILDPAHLAALLAHEKAGTGNREAPRAGVVALLEKALAAVTAAQ